MIKLFSPTVLVAAYLVNTCMARPASTKPLPADSDEQEEDIQHTSETYPTPDHQLNLRNFDYIKNHFLHPAIVELGHIIEGMVS